VLGTKANTHLKGMWLM